MVKLCKFIPPSVYDVFRWLSRKRRKKKVGDWSMIPSDVLGEIALRLDTIKEFVYFSMVCHSWKYACSKVKGKRNAMTLTPWLLLPETPKKNRNKHHLRKMYDLGSNKCYYSSMPETLGAQCWGSAYGWIVVLTIDQEVELYNPLNKNRVTTLPSLENRPIEQLPFDPLTDDPENMLRFIVLKVPQSYDDIFVAMVYGFKGSLAVAHPGDQAWTLIDDHVQDVVCWGDLLYIVGSTGCLRFCNIKGVRDFSNVEVIDYLPPFRSKSRLHCSEQVYLLNSGDDLLMVVRVMVSYLDVENYRSLEYGTNAFEVYRLDPLSKQWEETENLGDFSIFIGRNSSMSMPSSKANNLKGNCIYFTDDGKNYWLSMPESAGRDMGIYDMETRRRTKYYYGDDTQSTFCPTLFFVPFC